MNTIPLTVVTNALYVEILGLEEVVSCINSFLCFWK